MMTRAFYAVLLVCLLLVMVAGEIRRNVRHAETTPVVWTLYSRYATTPWIRMETFRNFRECEHEMFRLNNEQDVVIYDCSDR